MPGKLLLVANRLPVRFRKRDDLLDLTPSDGGLAAGRGALPCARESLWRGWPGDHRGFARRIIDILRSGEKAGQLGERAREHARRHFLVTRLPQDYLGLLRELT